MILATNCLFTYIHHLYVNPTSNTHIHTYTYTYAFGNTDRFAGGGPMSITPSGHHGSSAGYPAANLNSMMQRGGDSLSETVSCCCCYYLFMYAYLLLLTYLFVFIHLYDLYLYTYTYMHIYTYINNFEMMNCRYVKFSEATIPLLKAQVSISKIS